MPFTSQVDLNVLLQSGAKPAQGSVDRSSTKAVDVTKLDVCFGGFTPMALSDGSATREQVLAAEKRVRLHREAVEKAAALEAARASEERAWTDDAGTVWHYVVLDGAEARIVKCEPACEDIEAPASIEGKPVVSLAPDACSFLNGVESVVLPDSILEIGASAFRGCSALRFIHFPDTLPVFDSNWLRNCSSLARLELPGRLARIDAGVFDSPNLKELRIGAGTGDVVPGAFQKSHLEKIEVDPDNPLLSTDGQALYSFDGSIMVALAVPSERYAVRPGCRAIAKKAFSHFACLRFVGFPDSLEALGDFACAKTRIESFAAPSALRLIGEKAFFGCTSLRNVVLNEGLAEVRSDAFTDTAISELRLPASVERLGNPLAAGAGLTYVGATATFSIAAGSEHLLLDEEGCLYRKDANGLVLDRMMNPDIKRYRVRDGVVSIGEGAFSCHGELERVELPEGLEIIGKRAFKGCRKLADAALPSTVRVVEGEAFLDTALAQVDLPKGFERLGGNALVTYGAHHGSHPTLRSVSVAEGNPTYRMEGNQLLERKPNGAWRVILCCGDNEVIRIPDEVDELAPYAFNGIAGVREIYLSERVASVGMRALGIDGLVEWVHLQLAKPVGGRTSFTLHFPSTDRSAQQQMLALNVPDHVDGRILFEHYDTAIINASSFDALNVERLGVYDQATRLVERLKDPVFLTDVNRAMCERVLSTGIGDICVEAAKHDDRRLIDDLLDLGFVNDGNINEVIDRVGAVQDASMTGYLLEAKRERFGREAIDFNL